MQSELKPCPFCGSDRFMVLPPTCDRNTPYSAADRAYPVVRCSGCYTDVPGKDFDASSKSAVEAWNRRSLTAALSDKQAVEVKALPLNWATEKKSGFTIHVGRGLGLKYEACIKAYSPGWVVTLGQSDVIFDGAEADEDAAKAAAQADYEQRIRSALVDVPAVERSQPSTKPLPDQEYLCSILRYEWETGRLFWKSRESVPKGSVITWNKAHAGQEAFTYSDRRGYKIGKIDGEGYQAHRVIWKMVHGRDPDCIDHIDHNPSNNRIGNLRSCSNADNSRNYRISVSGTSKYRGVYRLKGSKTWIAQMADGKGGKRNLGTFDSEEEAARAYDAAARQYHGEFATLNFTSPPLSREGEDSAEVVRLRGLLSRAEEYVIDGVTNAKAEAEMNAPYPARAPRYDAALAEVRQLYADIQAALAATRSGSATTASGDQP